MCWLRKSKHQVSYVWGATIASGGPDRVLRYCDGTKRWSYRSRPWNARTQSTPKCAGVTAPPAPQPITDSVNGGQCTLPPLDNSTESREFFSEELSGTASTGCMTTYGGSAPYLRGRRKCSCRPADSRESLAGRSPSVLPPVACRVLS